LLHGGDDLPARKNLCARGNGIVQSEDQSGSGQPVGAEREVALGGLAPGVALRQLLAQEEPGARIEAVDLRSGLDHESLRLRRPMHAANAGNAPSRNGCIWLVPLTSP